MTKPEDFDRQKKHTLLIEEFYKAFQNRDGETMSKCYSTNASFMDPVFKLQGERIGSMWKMLCQNGKDLKIEFNNIKVDPNGDKGSAYWIATYTFSGTGRKVINKINSSFEFSEGKIVRQRDLFSFWKWASQALGPLGFFLGWTNAVRGQVQRLASKNLDQFILRRQSNSTK